MLSRFDETGIQLLSILLTFIIICISIPIYGYGPIENPHFYFLMTSIIILLIPNIMVILNLSPRIYAVIIGNGANYTKSAAKKIEEKIKLKMNKYKSVQEDKKNNYVYDEVDNDGAGGTRVVNESKGRIPVTTKSSMTPNLPKQPSVVQAYSSETNVDVEIELNLFEATTSTEL